MTHKRSMRPFSLIIEHILEKLMNSENKEMILNAFREETLKAGHLLKIRNRCGTRLLNSNTGDQQGAME